MNSSAIDQSDSDVHSDLVEIDNLSVEFQTRNGIVRAVSDVSFEVARGETLGIVGESGSGKSVTSYALMRILDRAGRISDGTVTFSGVDIRSASERQMRDLRGREISMIFQNPRAALNPIRKVGHQLRDALVQHGQAAGAKARLKAIELLDLVRIREPESRYDAYPYELSGGMCQRVVIALALACQPRLLIADEPTTGLDVTTQKAIMDLVIELTQARGMSTMLITHDLGLASAYCDRIIVMQSGNVVETADAKSLFAKPQHSYTQRLMRATPRLGGQLRDLLPAEPASSQTSPLKVSNPTVAPRPTSEPLLKVQNLVKEFPKGNPSGGGWINRMLGKSHDEPVFRAVNDISFEIPSGGSVGLVGESGCGKSTTSSMIMRLLDTTSGSIELNGVDLTQTPLKAFARSAHRAKLQMVFQDPTDSLNPRFTARRAIADPIRMLGDPEDRKLINDRVDQLASQVGLPGALLDRFPHQLSGGQKARVGIARAIALRPNLLILDEPTAALDVSVQAVVLNLLHDLRTELGMSYLFVSHDLNVVRLLCQHVLVMRNGEIIERGLAEEVMQNPQDPYTQSLIEAIPHPPL
ncbi:MAG: ABC transporter ATP-binding protein [Pseudomonadota bacterium]